MGVKQILGLIIFVILLIFIVNWIDVTVVPFVVKIEYDRICDNYLRIAVADGGLSLADENEFKNKIEEFNSKIKIVSTNISRNNSVRKGENVLFEVVSTYTKSRMTSIFNREDKIFTFRFNKTFRNNNITN